MDTTIPLSSAEKFDSIIWVFADSPGVTEMIILPGKQLFIFDNWIFTGLGGDDGIDFEIMEDDMITFINHILESKNTDEWSRKYILQSYNDKGHYNFSYTHEGMYFRINWSRYQGKQSIQLRRLPSKMKSPQELGIPDGIINSIKDYKQGWLIVVSAPTGNGKSTTIASVIQQLISRESVNVVTLEDPVEYIYEPYNSCVRQRELLFDFSSFEIGIEACLRQTPHIVVIQEMTNPSIVRDVFLLLKKWCLVITTLHSSDVPSAFEGIVSAFEEHDRDMILSELSTYFRCFISQRLIRTNEGKQRAIFEVLMPTGEVKWIILEKEFKSIRSVLTRTGNVSMTQEIVKAVKSGDINLEYAISICPQGRIEELKNQLGIS